MSAKLLVDPLTSRVVHVSRNGVLPERVFIVDGERQHSFFAGSCKVVDLPGDPPQGMNAQNCWGYKLGAGGVLDLAD